MGCWGAKRGENLGGPGRSGRSGRRMLKQPVTAVGRAEMSGIRCEFMAFFSIGFLYLIVVLNRCMVGKIHAKEADIVLQARKSMSLHSVL